MYRYCTPEIYNKKARFEHRQRFSVLNESVDRVLKKFQEDLTYLSGDETREITPKDRDTISFENLQTITTRSNSKIVPQMNEEMNDRKHRKGDAGVIGTRRKAIADCIIDNVSSITENEFNSIQDKVDVFLPEESPITINQKRSMDVAVKPIKPKCYRKGNKNTAQWISTSALAQSQNGGTTKQDNDLLNETNRKNDDSFSRNPKTLRPRGEQKPPAMINLAGHLENKFPYLSRSSILFDQNGNSVDRFIVRSDGIICPVKRVSAFSVVRKQHSVSSRNGRASLEKETSFDFQGLGEDRNVKKDANEIQKSAQGLLFGTPDNPGNDQTTPLPLGTLALQARAFRKFQYLMAFRFRQYFLREYVRSQRHYNTDEFNNLATPGLLRNSNMAGEVAGINSSDQELYKQRQAEVAHNKHVESNMVSGRLNPNGMARSNGTFPGIKSTEAHSFGITKRQKETHAGSLKDQVGTLNHDLWRHGFTNNVDNKRKFNMDQYNDRVLDVNTTYDVNSSRHFLPSPYTHPFDLQSSKLQTPSISRANTDEQIRSQHLFENGLFPRRQEIMDPPTSFEVYNSFDNGSLRKSHDKESSNSFYVPKDNFALHDSDLYRERFLSQLDKAKMAAITSCREPMSLNRTEYNNSMEARHRYFQQASVDSGASITRDGVHAEGANVPFPWSPNAETGFYNI